MDASRWLVLPLMLHLVLTFVVGSLSLRRRISSLNERRTTLEKIAVNSGNWPDDVRKFGNNFDNQFQVPMFAYAGVAMLLATGLADVTSAVMMWLFIAARAGHSVVHVTGNNVRHRLFMFLASFAAVIALWAWFAIRFFVTG